MKHRTQMGTMFLYTRKEQSYPIHHVKMVERMVIVMKALRSTIETAFYSNHVIPIKTLKDAYHLAYHAPATIVTDLFIDEPERMGLDNDSRILVTNDGKIVGRTARARYIVGKDTLDYCDIMRDVIAKNHSTRFYSAVCEVGMDISFCMDAHIMVSEKDSTNIYNFMLNFNNEINHTGRYSDAGIYIYVDSSWQDSRFPDGLVILDPDDNVGAILGLNYFGEIKKAVLSLAWNASKRHKYIPCHGGLKVVKHSSGYVMAVFGLSGSGKSTITLTDHNKRFETDILHDDAFIITEDGKQSIALEPSYFDKTADYPHGHPQQKYFLTAQNVGVTIKEGKRILVTEDVRNGNGRTIKSQYCTPNRIHVLNKKLDSIFWIMKDEAFPPLVRIDDPKLASILGATMTTQRSNAENTHEISARVIEPFANPFRLYPLNEDYQAFKRLFEKQDVSCYILNTGFFSGIKITPEITLSVIESVITGTAAFKSLCGIEGMSYVETGEFVKYIHKQEHILSMKESFEYRKLLLESWMDDFNSLPQEVYKCIAKIVDYLDDLKR